ncbi:MAG TPA: thiamine pyrophosphate-dependent enzyme [Steroidobacteraceae bacterium]|jgi:acetolactate synthase-1/2/3 large subunit|nr:thiamine pyrophosphate-dependent enzyme [Steroidobacteraceae bacterium]
MTSGQALVKSLINHGVDTVFGLPGVQTYALYDALHEYQSQVRYIGSRHEQGAAYMAFGYAKSTGRPGVYTVVPGPGVLNTSAALCSAYAANAPVLCLTGQVPSKGIGSGAGFLHELPDQLATLKLLTKWSARVDAPEQVPAVMDEAFRQMTTGRQRPVAIEVPWDVLLKKGNVQFPAANGGVASSSRIDSRSIDQAVALIREARQPMIMVGSGAMDAGAEVLEFAQRIQAPVTAFRSGRGVLSDESNYALTCAAAYRWWDKTDLLIGIGSRLELQYMRWPSRPAGLKLLRIDIDPDELARLRSNVGLEGDAKLLLAALNAALARSGFNPPSREQDILAVKEQTEKDIQEVQPQLDYLRAIRDVLPRDGFFVEEISQVGFASYFCFPVYEPRTFVTCGYQGTLGFGFPTALGVKVGNPSKPVVSITGDGGFMFGVQELAAAVQHDINLVTVLFNNNAFGNVLRDQQTKFRGPLGSELRNPDFVKLAESFGAQGWRAHNPTELRTLVERGFAQKGPVLIEVPVAQGSEFSPWKYLVPGGY